MLTKESTDKDILDYPLGGTTVRAMGSMSFMAWMAKKIDGVPTYRAATQELLGLLTNPPLGTIPESEKIKIIKKLLQLDIPLL